MTESELRAQRRSESALATLRRASAMPEFRRGLPVTFALALIATAGRVVVPVAVQQVLDRGLRDRTAPTWAWSRRSSCSPRSSSRSPRWPSSA